MDKIEILIDVTDWRNAPADMCNRAEILHAIADAARFAAEQEADRQDIAVRIHDELVD